MFASFDSRNFSYLVWTTLRKSLRRVSRVRKIPWSLFTLTTSGILAFFLARQPQGVLLDRFPPFKPCANEFSLPFSYIKTLARP
jgi:hypothetical protein